MLLILFTPSLAEAQIPTPPSVPTLGPVIICSAGDSLTNVVVFSPQNQSYLDSSQIQLIFRVKAAGLFGQFGNIGYRLDGGIINSVSGFINKSVEDAGPELYWKSTTVFASVALSQLSVGLHNVIVYYGWQYLGIPANPSLQRYEVFAYASVDFSVVDYITVDASPPNISELSMLNKTYNLDTIPLSFSVDEDTSWIGYCLDDSANVTLLGNTTISGLSEGSHSLVIYANDTAGNMGASNTVFFTVNTATPTPSPSPSPSPSPTPTLSPYSSNSPTQQPTIESTLPPGGIPDIWGNYVTWYFVGLVVVAFVVIFILFLSKRKG